jgi:hypothetical protein
MANIRAERLVKIPEEPALSCVSPAPQLKRKWYVAGIRLRSRESARACKGIFCDDISEFEFA